MMNLTIRRLKELIEELDLQDDMPVMLDDGTVGLPPHTYNTVMAVRVEDIGIYRDEECKALILSPKL